MANGKPRVFISAVSGEFETARNSVAADLRARDCAVTIQSDFKQGPDSVTLLNSLYDYIRDCQAVVCLVGKRAGAYPPKAAAERFTDMLLPGMVEASYTQWEYLFARHFNRRLYIYLAGDDWTPDTAGDPDERQRLFAQYLMNQGVHRTPFSTIDQLGRAILKEEFAATPTVAPQPAPKPIVLPYPSIGPLFKGRTWFVQQLRERLVGTGEAPITSIALYGLGGIGKTRVAVEYAWKHRDAYGAVLFVVADTPEPLRRNLAALTPTLLPRFETTDDTAKLQAVFDWLGANPNWLVILDNVDTKEALREAEALLAKLAGGHVVITTRLADFSANFEPLSLDPISPGDATSFLLERTRGRRRATPDDETHAGEIAEEFDRLALALEQAGAYIAKHRLTLEDYLQLWGSKREEVLSWFDETVTGYPRAVAITWQTSVAQLTEPGRRLLERLAWFAPERVPDFLLDVPVPAAETEEQRVALADLAAYSLVTRDAAAPFFLVHRLVQDVTRRSLADDRKHASLNSALAWIDAAFPDKAQDVRTWPRAEALEPHALAIAAEADSAAIFHPTARLMNRLGLLLSSKALYAAAEPLFRRALAICEAEAEPSQRLAATVLNNLGGVYQSQGRYAEAEPLFVRSLALSEETLAPDDPDVAAALNNIAELYRVQGRYDEAEPLFRRALEITKDALGPNHPDVAATLNNLGLLYREQSRYDAAEPLHQRALAISEQAFAPDHLNVALALNNLAPLYRQQGRYADAEPLYQRSLAIRENTLAPDHPDVAASLSNLAVLYRAQGRYAEAEPFYRRSLAIRERALGSLHNDVANSYNGLGVLYAAQERYNEARPYLRRCVSILLAISRQIGRPHPYLRAATSNYADVLQRLGRTDEEIRVEIEGLAADNE